MQRMPHSSIQRGRTKLEHYLGALNASGNKEQLVIQIGIMKELTVVQRLRDV